MATPVLPLSSSPSSRLISSSFLEKIIIFILISSSSDLYLHLIFKLEMLNLTPLIKSLDHAVSDDEKILITTLIEMIEAGDTYPYHLYHNGDGDRRLSHQSYNALGEVLNALDMSDLCFKKMKEELMVQKKALISGRQLKISGDLGKRKVGELTGSANETHPVWGCCLWAPYGSQNASTYGEEEEEEEEEQENSLSARIELATVKEEEEDDKSKVPLIVSSSHTTDSSLEILDVPGDFAPQSKMKHI